MMIGSVGTDRVQDRIQLLQVVALQAAKKPEVGYVEQTSQS